MPNISRPLETSNQVDRHDTPTQPTSSFAVAGYLCSLRKFDLDTNAVAGKKCDK